MSVLPDWNDLPESLRGSLMQRGLLCDPDFGPQLVLDTYNEVRDKIDDETFPLFRRPAIGAVLAALHADLNPAILRLALLQLRDYVVASRPPDVLIGGVERPYMRRWWLIPRDKHGFNVYLHHFLRSDDDRALHDHPWANLSVLIEGAYFEVTPQGRECREAGDIAWRPADARHRIELPRHEQPTLSSAGRGFDLVETPCWTLFVTGPKVREWGFHCPKGWVHWKDFTGQDDANGPVRVSVVGAGCGETS